MSLIICVMLSDVKQHQYQYQISSTLVDRMSTDFNRCI